MIKNIKYFAIFFVFTLIIGCSFDDKTGIWSGSEKEKRRISDLETEQKGLIPDKKFYDVRRKKVLNKLARWNLCFGEENQETRTGIVIALNKYITVS